MADELHHRFIRRGNALAEEFAGAATMTAATYGKVVEDRLIRLLAAIDTVPGNPFESAAVRSALDAFFAEAEALGIRFFGPGSVFERQTMTVMGSMARNGMDRLLAEFRAQRFVLKQQLLDAPAIRAAATDTYRLAARNLGSVDPLRKLITTELIQGNGPMSLAQSLASAGYLVNGKTLPLIEPLVRGGKTYSVQQRAEMMARTEPMRLQEMAYQAGTAKVEPDPEKRYYRWVSVLAPTSTIDSLDRHGHLLTKPEWDTTRWPHDNYSGFPPLRPNDRCSTIFYKESWLSKENLDAVKKTEPTGDGRLAITDAQKKILADLKNPPKPPKVAATVTTQAKAAAATPAPVPVGPPTFNTVSEADAWIRQSGALVPDQFVGKAAGIPGDRLDLSAMTTSGANQTVAFFDWLKGLKLPKVVGVRGQPDVTSYYGQYLTGTRRINLGRGRLDGVAGNEKAAKAAAAYAKRADEVVAHQAKYKAAVAQAESEEMQVVAKVKAAAKGSAERTRLEEYLAAVRGDLKNSRRVVDATELGARTRRWSLSDGGPEMGNSTESTLVHEYGHMIHNLMNKPDPAMAAMFPGAPNTGYAYGYTRLGGRWAKGSRPTYRNLYEASVTNMSKGGKLKAATLSEYATTNHAECFAEAFTAYVRGHKGLLAPEVLEVVEEVLANAREMGLTEWGN